MGRAFEYRKARKLKRWGNMSRTFTRIGKEITIAVKAGGPDPSGNSRLRALIANAKAENMPKATWMNAIKKATESDAKDYKEVIYEGFAPNGIAVIVECATDNTTRTVANLRNYFNKNGGTLGNSGTTIFMFSHKCYFHVKPKDGVTLDDLELELIDCSSMSRPSTKTSRARPASRSTSSSRPSRRTKTCKTCSPTCASPTWRAPTSSRPSCSCRELAHHITHGGRCATCSRPPLFLPVFCLYVGKMA